MAILIFYGWIVLVPLVGLIYFLASYYQARPLAEIAVVLFGYLCWAVAGGVSVYPFLVTDSWQALAAGIGTGFAIIVCSLLGLALNIFLTFSGLSLAVLAMFNVIVLAMVGVVRRHDMIESFQKSQEEKYEKDLEKYKNDLKNQFLEAVKSGDVETVNSLIESRIDFLKGTVLKPTTLQRAVEHGHIEVVKALIQAGAQLHPWLLGFAPNENTALFLVEAGIDVNDRGSDGFIALIRLSHTGQTDVIRFLIEAGADVNAKNKKGRTALMYASNGEVAKILIESGADLNAKDQKGETPLMSATRGVRTGVVKVLIEAGADVNAKDKEGRTVLMYASKGEVAKILIEAGADLNAKNQKGETPLMRACRGLCTGAVKVLIEAGADVNAANPDGETALKLAVKTGDTETINVLREAGATD